MSTFKTLCSLADFGTLPSEVGAPMDSSPTTHGTTSIAPDKSIGQKLSININIQLQLPETKDGEVYEKLFQALKKNILSPEEK